MTGLFSEREFTVLIHPYQFNEMIKYHIPNKKIVIIFVQSNVSMNILFIHINASSFFIPSKFLASVIFCDRRFNGLKSPEGNAVFQNI